MQLLLRWHGHACFELVQGGSSLVFDPHDGDYIGIARPKAKADIVLVSHEHKDHNAVGVVAKDGAFVQHGCGSFEKSGFSVTSSPCWHDEAEGAKRGANTIFKVVAGGVSLVHMGDLGVMPDEAGRRLARNADILMVPVGGTFTVDPSSANEVVEALAPRVAIPMHYRMAGLKFMLSPVDAFLTRMKGRKVTKVGGSVEFSKSDLPGEPTAWVFSL